MATQHSTSGHGIRYDAKFMCLVLFLPVQSLLTCFRSLALSLSSRMHYGITLWAYLFEPLVKDSHKHLSSTEKPQHRMLQVT